MQSRVHQSLQQVQLLCYCVCTYYRIMLLPVCVMILKEVVPRASVSMYPGMKCRLWLEKRGKFLEQLLGDIVGKGLSSRPGRIGEGTKHRAEGKCRAMSAKEITLIWGQQAPGGTRRHIRLQASQERTHSS